MKFIKLFLFMSLTVLFGCKRPLPEPQANDYIYLNFKQQLGDAEARLLEKEGQLKEFQEKINEADIQSSERKLIQAKADFALREVRKMQQNVKYWKLKLLSREEVVRRSYLRAFNSGLEWDNSAEVARFKKANEKLSKRALASSQTKEKSLPELPSDETAASGEVGPTETQAEAD
jgi:hypothetical protein